MRNKELCSDYMYELFMQWSDNEEAMLLHELTHYYNQSIYGSRNGRSETYKQQNKEAFEMLLEETNYPLEKFQAYYEKRYKRETNWRSGTVEGCGEDYLSGIF